MQAATVAVAIADTVGRRILSSPSPLGLPLPPLLPFGIDQTTRRYCPLEECCPLERQGGRKVDELIVHKDVGEKDDPTQEDAIIVVSVVTLPSSSLCW